MTLPKTFKQAVFKKLGGPLTIEDAQITPPSEGEVLVKVEACGVCYSDSYTQKNIWGGGLYVFSFTNTLPGYISFNSCFQA